MERLQVLLEPILGKGRQTARNNVAFYCPFCNHHKRKLEIQMVQSTPGENHFHCWACNKKGKKISVLLKSLSIPRETISEIIKEIGDTHSLNIQYTNFNVPEIQLPKEYKPLYYASDSIEYRNAIHYLLTRNITLSEIIKYNIGYCEDGEYAKKIIIPSYDETGKLNYFIGRSYYKSESFKYKNPPISKEIIGFGLNINWKLPVVLVEGAFDAIAVRRNAIPLFGNTIPNILRKKLIEERVKQIYICLDKDAQTLALESAEYFMRNGMTVYFVDLHLKDPADIGFIDMCSLIKNTKPFTLNKLVEYKLWK